MSIYFTLKLWNKGCSSSIINRDIGDNVSYESQKSELRQLNDEMKNLIPLKSFWYTSSWRALKNSDINLG